MTRIFADTSYWLALLNPEDELHPSAVILARKFSSAKIVTSEMVFVEVLNSFSKRGPYLRKAAAQAVEALRRNRSVIVWPQTSEQFEAGLNLYDQASDKAWSITDCASFQIMQAERISVALTHDYHFAQAGYDVLLQG